MTDPQQTLFEGIEGRPLHCARPCTPAPIGSGPEGETCGTCRHKSSQGGTAGRYLKCGLLEEHWTRGPGTDIRAWWAACRYWEAKERRAERAKS